MTDLYLCSVSEGVCRKHNSVMVRKISEGIKARDGGKSSDVPLGDPYCPFCREAEKLKAGVKS